MRPGEQLGGRWRLEESLPTADRVARFRATDVRTGEEVEVLVLPDSRSSADDRRAFVEAHRRMQDAEGGVSVASRDVGHTATAAWAVRRRVSDATLADVKGPIDPPVVAAIGARLLRAVVASGEATRGTLLPSDIALDDRGAPVLAPRGAPLDPVVRGTSRAVAPEVYAGGTPDGAAGLYGLGVVLYRLATGRAPASTSPPAPPSSVREDVPEALDDAVTRLLSADPAARAGALARLEEAAGDSEASDLGRYVRDRAPLGDVNVSVSGTGEGAARRRSEPPRALVIVGHRALAALDPRGRHAAAGVAGVSLDVVEEAIDKRLPLVVSGHSLRVKAQREATALSAKTGLPLEAGVSGSGAGLWLPLFAALAIGLALAPLVVVFALTGLAGLAFPAGVVLAADGVFGIATWLLAARRAADWSRSTDAWRLVTEHHAARAGLGLKAVSDDLAAVRRQIAQAWDLPETAASDLRSVLKEVDAKIGALEARSRASAGVTDRARLAADADVDSAEASATEEVARLRDALGELSAALGRAEGGSEEALAALGREARHVQDAAVSINAGSRSEAERRRERLLARPRAERTTR